MHNKNSYISKICCQQINILLNHNSIINIEFARKKIIKNLAGTVFKLIKFMTLWYILCFIVSNVSGNHQEYRFMEDRIFYQQICLCLYVNKVRRTRNIKLYLSMVFQFPSDSQLFLSKLDSTPQASSGGQSRSVNQPEAIPKYKQSF